MERLYDLLGMSDAVVLACPLTPASRGLFNAATFRAMQRHAVLINVGRGEVTEEEALVTALRDGWIAGAGLDVTPVEPLPRAHPLWSMENVVISFHTAGATPHRGARLVERFGHNLIHFLAGEPLEGVIDKARGC
jgi:phosphoglycerate dehydrogenase-like enzyme